MQNLPVNILHTLNVSEWDPGIGDTPDTSSGSYTPFVDAENPSFPVENVLDGHPQNLSKTTQETVVYELSELFSGSGITLFNCECSSILIRVYDETDTEIPELAGDYNMTGIDTYQQLVTDDTNYQTALYHPYDYLYTQHTIRVFVTARATENASCGVMVVGAVVTVEDPPYPVTQSFKDYSIVTELNSGATYTLTRPMVRKFSFELDVETCTGTPHVLMRIFKQIGPEPIPWLIVDEGNQELWLAFARKDAQPLGNFYAFNRTKIPISLIEVL